MTSRRIIICATQRSGSTLICEDLRNNELGLAEEHFLRVIAPNRPRNRAADLQIVEKASRGENGVFSIKVMSSYADQVDQLLATPEGTDDAGKLWSGLHGYFREAIWVYVTRRSTIRQAVSRLVATHTGVNHALAEASTSFVPGKSQIGYTADYNRNVPFHPAEIERHIINIATENFRWERFFAQHGIEPMRLVYEDFVDDPSYVSAIRAAAGLPDAPVRAPRNLMKLANEKTESIIEQFLAAAPDRLRMGRPPKRESAVKAPRQNADAGGAAGQGSVRSEDLSASMRRWANSPYYAAAEKVGRASWDRLIAPFLADQKIDYATVLNLGIGHGRMTEMLLDRANHIIGVDFVQENIDFCRKRFANSAKVTLLKNDGLTLDGVGDRSVSFVFCFDTMVNFDLDVVQSYLMEIHRVLKPDGTAFCHHSNFSKNPDGDFRLAPHARNFMNMTLFRHLAYKAGLTVQKSEVIDWGSGEGRVPNLDCLSLLRRSP